MNEYTSSPQEKPSPRSLIHKYWPVVLSFLVLFILAAGLKGVELLPGRQFDIQEAANTSGWSTMPPAGGWWVHFLRGLTILVVILAVLSLIYMLIDKNRRKRLVADLVAFGLILLVLYGLQQYLSSRPLERQEQEPPPPLPSGQMTTVVPSGEKVEFTAPASNSYTAWVVGAIAALLIASAGIAWAAWRRNQPKELVEMSQIADQAEETLEELLAGADFQTSIRRMYRKMTDVIEKSEGIFRDPSATPHEFERTLQTKGLPPSATHELTAIFEEVRYGEAGEDGQKRDRAIRALQRIILYCRKEETGT